MNTSHLLWWRIGISNVILCATYLEKTISQWPEFKIYARVLEIFTLINLSLSLTTKIRSTLSATFLHWTVGAAFVYSTSLLPPRNTWPRNGNGNTSQPVSRVFVCCCVLKLRTLAADTLRFRFTFRTPTPCIGSNHYSKISWKDTHFEEICRNFKCKFHQLCGIKYRKFVANGFNLDWQIQKFSSK